MARGLWPAREMDHPFIHLGGARDGVNTALMVTDFSVICELSCCPLQDFSLFTTSWLGLMVQDGPPPAMPPTPGNDANVGVAGFSIALFWMLFCLSQGCVLRRHSACRGTRANMKCKCIRQEDAPDTFFMLMVRDCVIVLALLIVAVICAIMYMAPYNDTRVQQTGRFILVGASGALVFLCVLLWVKSYVTRAARRRQQQIAPVIGVRVEPAAQQYQADANAPPLIDGVPVAESASSRAPPEARERGGGDARWAGAGGF